MEGEEEAEIMKEWLKRREKKRTIDVQNCILAQNVTCYRARLHNKCFNYLSHCHFSLSSSFASSCSSSYAAWAGRLNLFVGVFSSFMSFLQARLGIPVRCLLTLTHC